MRNKMTRDSKLLGLLELDVAGTVIYSRVESDGDGHEPVRDLKGCNFFTEVAPFRNVEEFRECFDGFRHSSQQFNSSNFICQYEDGPLQVRVMLARVREARGVTKSILVQIRKAD